MRKKIATAAVAIGCLAAPVLGMGTANAVGSTGDFRVNVGLSGTSEWVASWTKPAAATGCGLAITGLTLPTSPSTLQSGIGSGKVQTPSTDVQVKCTSGEKSNKVTIYGPRGALNDLRTTFSNDTQGVFGS